MCLDGCFALYGAHGYVSVDDVAVLACDAEIVEYHVHDFRAVAVSVVIAFSLGICRSVVNEIAFECGHAVLVEEWAVLSAPQVPEVVDGVLALFGFCVGGEVKVVSMLGGNVIVKVKESRVALSDELARKIMV